MIPKKLIFFGLLVFGGLAYFLKDQGLNKLQPKAVQEDIKAREAAKEGRTYLGAEEEKKLEAKKALEEDAKKRGYRFLPGQCVSNREDGWEFTKILGVGDGTYKLIDCHKYKGCTEQKELPWTDIEFEYRKGRLIECSR
jgi:hypothetical protein